MYTKTLPAFVNKLRLHEFQVAFPWILHLCTHTHTHKHTHTHTHTYTLYIQHKLIDFYQNSILNELSSKHAVLFVTLLTYLLTYLLHTAAFFLRNYSRNSAHFTEPESSLPHSRVPNCPYPEPDRSRVSVNILNKKSRTAEKGWSSSLRFGRGVKNSSPYKRIVLQIIQKGLGP